MVRLLYHNFLPEYIYINIAICHIIYHYYKLQMTLRGIICWREEKWNTFIIDCLIDATCQTHHDIPSSNLLLYNDVWIWEISIQIHCQISINFLSIFNYGRNYFKQRPHDNLIHFRVTTMMTFYALIRVSTRTIEKEACLPGIQFLFVWRFT